MEEILLKINNIEKVKKFVNTALEFNSDIDVVYGKYIVDAKSIMGVFSLDLSKNLVVRINSNDREEINKFYEVMKEFSK